MKKLLVAGLVSLATLGVAAPYGVAGLLSHLFCCKHGSCSMHITCRPYNAFTPFCSGSMYCDGCCPIGCGMPQMPCMPPGPPMFNPYCGPIMPPCCDYGPPSCCTTGCGDNACLPAPGAVGQAPVAPPAAPNTFTPPPPTPLPAMSYNGLALPMPVGPIQSVGYYPQYPQYPQNYYQGYYQNYQPYAVPYYYAPAYWYGYGMPGYGR